MIDDNRFVSGDGTGSEEIRYALELGWWITEQISVSVHGAYDEVLDSEADVWRLGARFRFGF